MAGDLVLFFMTDQDKQIDEGAWHGYASTSLLIMMLELTVALICTRACPLNSGTKYILQHWIGFGD